MHIAYESGTGFSKFRRWSVDNLPRTVEPKAAAINLHVRMSPIVCEVSNSPSATGRIPLAAHRVRAIRDSADRITPDPTHKMRAGECIRNGSKVRNDQ